MRCVSLCDTSRGKFHNTDGSYVRIVIGLFVDVYLSIGRSGTINPGKRIVGKRRPEQSDCQSKWTSSDPICRTYWRNEHKYRIIKQNQFLATIELHSIYIEQD